MIAREPTGGPIASPDPALPSAQVLNIFKITLRPETDVSEYVRNLSISGIYSQESASIIVMVANLEILSPAP